MEGKVYVVGVGPQGRASLMPGAAEIVCRAGLLVGGRRLLAMFPDHEGDRLLLSGDLAEVIRQIEASLTEQPVVVLASGDPSFFGFAKRLAAQLGKDRLEIVPNLSSVQLAFARIKESWEDAAFASVHGRPLSGLVDWVRENPKVAILGDENHSPSVIARALLAGGLRGYRAYVCENLGLPEERLLDLSLPELAETTTGPLCVLVLIRQTTTDDERPIPGGPTGRTLIAWQLGIPDDEFHQRRPRRGLITKLEVRLASLAGLRLREDSIVWDVGAGCGSVSIEAAMIARQGRVYAVERSADDIVLIQQNVAKFGTENVQVVHGEAPNVLEFLPNPDAVFIGGSRGQLPAILDELVRRLKTGGRVVVNAASLETANAAATGLRQRGFAIATTLLQVARGKDLNGLTHFEAFDPVFVVACARSSTQ